MSSVLLPEINEISTFPIFPALGVSDKPRGLIQLHAELLPTVLERGARASRRHSDEVSAHQLLTTEDVPRSNYK